jgi:hypothetical protein
MRDYEVGDRVIVNLWRTVPSKHTQAVFEATVVEVGLGPRRDITKVRDLDGKDHCYHESLMSR